MRKDITITAEPRETRGKNEARRLRVRGLAPAVVYGAGADPVAVAVNPKEVDTHPAQRSGHNTIFNVDIQRCKSLRSWSSIGSTTRSKGACCTST